MPSVNFSALDMWQVLHFLSKARITLLRIGLAAGEAFGLVSVSARRADTRVLVDASMRRLVKEALMGCTVRFVPRASSPSLVVKSPA
jgi:hypothetical protein